MKPVKNPPIVNNKNCQCLLLLRTVFCLNSRITKALTQQLLQHRYPKIYFKGFEALILVFHQHNNCVVLLCLQHCSLVFVRPLAGFLRLLICYRFCVFLLVFSNFANHFYSFLFEVLANGDSV